MYQTLAKLMEEHNETAADLSRATGISEAQISMWKRRNGGMSVQNAIIIAEHYKISVPDLIRGGRIMPKVKGLIFEQKLDYQKSILANRCEHEMLDSKVNKSDLARYMGISPQAVWRQFKEKTITVDTLMAVVTLCKVDGDKLKSMLEVEK